MGNPGRRTDLGLEDDEIVRGELVSQLFARQLARVEEPLEALRSGRSAIGKIEAQERATGECVRPPTGQSAAGGSTKRSARCTGKGWR